jgi:small-conductance mechanosensitive channel
MVVVRRVNFRNTVVVTMDNATVFVPNSELITGRVTNLSHADPTVRREVTVGVAYGSDRELVRRLLLEAAARSPRVLAEPAPSVVFTDFGPSALEFRLRVWINEPQDGLTIVSGVREAIDDLFRQNGVEISYPQTDVHLRTAPGLTQALDATREAWNTSRTDARAEPDPAPDAPATAPNTPGRNTP